MKPNKIRTLIIKTSIAFISQFKRLPEITIMAKDLRAMGWVHHR